MSDKNQNNDSSSDLNQEENKSGLLYEDVPPEVYEDDDQIRVSDLLNIIWEGRKKILLITLILFAFSIFHVVTAPKEYVAESRFLPERQVQQFQMDRMFAFGEVARALNIAPTETDGSLPSYFYPDIIASVDFQSELLAKEIDLFNDGRRVTLFEFFTDVYEQPFRSRFYSAIKYNTIGLPMRFFQFIIGIFTPTEELRQISVQDTTVIEDSDRVPSIIDPHVAKRERYIVLSPEYDAASRSLISRIKVDYGTLTIEVSAIMPDPMAAVQVNGYVADMVQNFLIDYRIGKAKQNLEYIETLYSEAENRYEAASIDLALFRDSNRGDLTALAQLELETLVEKRNLAYSLYSSISSRKEEALTRVKEDTPIYTPFQEPIFPNTPTGESLLILPASIFIGLFLGIIWTFLEILLKAFGRTFSRLGSFGIFSKK